MNEPSIIRLTDSYKVTHWKQYPPGTTKVYSFFESRGGKFPSVTFFGLQYYLKKYLVGEVLTEEDIVESKERFGLHFGDPTLFNEDGWRRMLKMYGGKLPLEIRAVPEGTNVPTHNVLMTVENTDPKLPLDLKNFFPWLTNYEETLLSEVWYPSTVTTLDRGNKALILRYLEETGDPSLIDFKLHDFGFRGSTSPESAGIGGAAHLVNFKGTDTFAGVDMAYDYYHEKMAGFSIPAAEHSTITSWGRTEEARAYENMLDQFPGLVAVVSDSYDIFHACREIWGKQLRDKVLKRNGVLIIRPDSGDPPTVVVKVLEILGQAFGYRINAKGYKVLDPHVRIIQGDGIDYAMLGLILEAMKQTGWSADNIAFGSGGGLLQKMDRDTQKFAFKCSSIQLVNGVWRDVMKDPVTDPGKRSKAGRLALVKKNGLFVTMRQEEAARLGRKNELIPVFRNGELLVDHTFAEVRARALVDCQFN